MTVGEKIKMYREKKGYTLEELGNRVGVGKSTIRKWENGIIKNMRRDKIQILAEVLGCSPLEFIDVDEKVIEKYQKELDEYVVRQQEKEDAKGTSNIYYKDIETQEIAQQIFQNEELRLLFDAAKDASPEDLKTVHTMLTALKKKEG